VGCVHVSVPDCLSLCSCIVYIRNIPCSFTDYLRATRALGQVELHGVSGKIQRKASLLRKALFLLMSTACTCSSCIERLDRNASMKMVCEEVG